MKGDLTTPKLDDAHNVVGITQGFVLKLFEVAEREEVRFADDLHAKPKQQPLKDDA